MSKNVSNNESTNKQLQQIQPIKAIATATTTTTTTTATSTNNNTHSSSHHTHSHSHSTSHNHSHRNDTERIRKKFRDAIYVGNFDRVARIIKNILENNMLDLSSVLLPYASRHVTPIGLAARRGHVKICKVLVEVIKEYVIKQHNEKCSELEMKQINSDEYTQMLELKLINTIAQQSTNAAVAAAQVVDLTINNNSPNECDNDVAEVEDNAHDGDESSSEQDGVGQINSSPKPKNTDDICQDHELKEQETTNDNDNDKNDDDKQPNTNNDDELKSDKENENTNNVCVSFSTQLCKRSASSGSLHHNPRKCKKMITNDSSETCMKSSQNEKASNNNNNSLQDIGILELSKHRKSRSLPYIHLQSMLNRLDGENRTALSHACEKGQREVIEFLLSEPGIEIEAGGKHHEESWTNLHWACRYGHDHIVQLLINHNANINAQTSKKKSTGLHLACATGHTDVIHVLLQNGAAKEIEDVYGCSPLSLAIHFGEKKVQQILYEAGIDVSPHDARRLKKDNHIFRRFGWIKIPPSIGTKNILPDDVWCLVCGYLPCNELLLNVRLVSFGFLYIVHHPALRKLVNFKSCLPPSNKPDDLVTYNENHQTLVLKAPSSDNSFVNPAQFNFIAPPPPIVGAMPFHGHHPHVPHPNGHHALPHALPHAATAILANHAPLNISNINHTQFPAIPFSISNINHHPPPHPHLSHNNNSNHMSVHAHSLHNTHINNNHHPPPHPAISHHSGHHSHHHAALSLQQVLPPPPPPPALSAMYGYHHSRSYSAHSHRSRSQPQVIHSGANNSNNSHYQNHSALFNHQNISSSLPSALRQQADPLLQPYRRTRANTNSNSSNQNMNINNNNLFGQFASIPFPTLQFTTSDSANVDDDQKSSNNDPLNNSNDSTQAQDGMSPLSAEYIHNSRSQIDILAETDTNLPQSQSDLAANNMVTNMFGFPSNNPSNSSLTQEMNSNSNVNDADMNMNLPMIPPLITHTGRLASLIFNITDRQQSLSHSNTLNQIEEHENDINNESNVLNPQTQTINSNKYDDTPIPSDQLSSLVIHSDDPFPNTRNDDGGNDNDGNDERKSIDIPPPIRTTQIGQIAVLYNNNRGNLNNHSNNNSLQTIHQREDEQSNMNSIHEAFGNIRSLSQQQSFGAITTSSPPLLSRTYSHNNFNENPFDQIVSWTPPISPPFVASNAINNVNSNALNMNVNVAVNMNAQHNNPNIMNNPMFNNMTMNFDVDVNDVEVKRDEEIDNEIKDVVNKKTIEPTWQYKHCKWLGCAVNFGPSSLRKIRLTGTNILTQSLIRVLSCLSFIVHLELAHFHAYKLAKMDLTHLSRVSQLKMIRQLKVFPVIRNNGYHEAMNDARAVAQFITSIGSTALTLGIKYENIENAVVNGEGTDDSECEETNKKNRERNIENMKCHNLNIAQCEEDDYNMDLSILSSLTWKSLFDDLPSNLRSLRLHFGKDDCLKSGAVFGLKNFESIKCFTLHGDPGLEGEIREWSDVFSKWNKLRYIVLGHRNNTKELQVPKEILEALPPMLPELALNISVHSIPNVVWYLKHVVRADCFLRINLHVVHKHKSDLYHASIHSEIIPCLTRFVNLETAYLKCGMVTLQQIELLLVSCSKVSFVGFGIDADDEKQVSCFKLLLEDYGFDKIVVKNKLNWLIAVKSYDKLLLDPTRCIHPVLEAFDDKSSSSSSSSAHVSKKKMIKHTPNRNNNILPL